MTVMEAFAPRPKPRPAVEWIALGALGALAALAAIALAQLRAQLK